MKTILKAKKSFSLLLIMLVLLNSCRVYKNQESSLEEAFNQQKRVKIDTKDGKTLKFKKIEKVNDTYFGVKKVKGEVVQIPIDQTEVLEVNLHKKEMSIIGTLAILLGLGTFIVALANFEIRFGDGDGLSSPN